MRSFAVVASWRTTAWKLQMSDHKGVKIAVYNPRYLTGGYKLKNSQPNHSPYALVLSHLNLN